jgi:hypothetical protein
MLTLNDLFQGFRQPRVIRALAAQINELAKDLPEPLRVMEVCGGHTHTIMKYGLHQLLPASIEFVHGPGCPVCIMPKERIDQAIELASQPSVILVTLGDMIRVPGSIGTLAQQRAKGSDIRPVYDPLDALRIAKENPEKTVVFFAIGFETSTPMTAALLAAAEDQGGRGFEADGEEDHGFFRVLFGDAQGIEGVIDRADIAPLGALLGQRAYGARHPDHVPQGDQNDARLTRQLDGLIDALFGHDADRAAGAMDKLDAGRQQLVQAVFHDGVGMATAHLHHPQRLGQIFGELINLGGEGADHPGLTKALKEIIQGQHGKISCLGIRATIWRKLSRLACASASSILLITKPIWSST